MEGVMQGMQAYGAGKAGGAFDPLTFFQQPQTILRLVCWVTFWSFVWFVGFCFLANQWQVAKEEDNPLREGADAARAAITFAFFSIFTWAVQAFLGFQKYKLGADSALFSQEYVDPTADPNTVAPMGTDYTGYTADIDPVASTEPAFDGSAGYQGQEY
ncbi:hypothetical protein J4Q44_G00301310 [Coregonus suidteri]|uniref:MARVEL domain-containing protein n=1 Tax=Coregonus suidteri TaxID=861788 RepID=A0AAN8KXU0_9TELE